MQHSVVVSTRTEDPMAVIERLALHGPLKEFLKALLEELQDIKDALTKMEEALKCFYHKVRGKDLSREELRFAMKELNQIERVDDARERIQHFQSWLKSRRIEIHKQYTSDVWRELINELNCVFGQATSVVKLEIAMEDKLELRGFQMSW